MYVIQVAGPEAYECLGEIGGKSKTIKGLLKIVEKEYEDYDYEITYDSHYIYLDGEVIYSITKI